MSCTNAEELDCAEWIAGTYGTTHGANIEADPDVAGVGIVTAFLATSILAVIIAYGSLLFTIIPGLDDNPIDAWVMKILRKVSFLNTSDGKREFWTPVVERVLLNLSDQQVVTGLAMLIAGYMKHCSINFYHFEVIFYLAWLSSHVHLTTIHILHAYLADRPQLRNWRLFFLIVMLVMTSIMIYYIGRLSHGADVGVPMQCMMQLPENKTWDMAGLSISLFWVFAISWNFIPSIIRLFLPLKRFCATWFLHKPQNRMTACIERLRNRRWSHPIGPLFHVPIIAIRVVRKLHHIISSIVRSTVLSILVDTFWFLIAALMLLWSRQSIRISGRLDRSEDEWGFGQIVPVLILASTILVFSEVYTERLEDTGDITPLHSDPPPSNYASPDLRKSGNVDDMEMESGLLADVQPVAVKAETYVGRVAGIFLKKKKSKKKKKK
ncbi:hypothetical protein MMC09_000108 [Bachmanniomyces sp. S44760]|nr:hypothetical protein [Bachmanniomyces sp. S44760]